jgi:hypothetical protein
MSLYQTFNQQFEAQINTLWESVRTKKRQLWDEFRQPIADRKAFKQFQIDYHTLFDPLRDTEKTLSDLISLLNTRLRLSQSTPDVEEVAEELQQLDLKIADIKTASNETEMPELIFTPVSDAATPEQHPPPTPLPIPEEDHLSDAKHAVAVMFRNIYHPRTETDVDTWAKLIQDIEDDKFLDEVDLILSLPFDETYEMLWGEKFSKNESLGARYYRYALWDRMLDEAKLTKVPEIRRMITNPLYHLFCEMREAKQTMADYFQEDIKQLQASIQQLEAQAKSLQSRTSL